MPERKPIVLAVPGEHPMVVSHVVLFEMGWIFCSSPCVSRQRIADDEDEVMVIRTIVAAVFFVVCAVVMHKMFWMLEQCVPITQEAASQARARRWKGIVAAVVVGAWVCAGGIAFGFDMPKALCAVIFAGPMAITFPVLAWVFLVY